MPRQSHSKSLLEYMTHEALAHFKHIVPLYEGHLDIDLGELGLSVAPGILVAVTTGQLEIFIETRNHEYLLVQLGRLGQGVEFARIEPGGDKIVPGPLGGGTYEGRGFYLVKTLSDHVFPRRESRFVAEAYLALHGGRAQVQVAVGQAGIFFRVAPLVDLEGQGIALGQDNKVLAYHFDSPCVHVRVYHGFGSAAHPALDRDAILVFKLRRRRQKGRGGIGVHHYLGDAIAIP